MKVAKHPTELEETIFDAIHISDLHLGSDSCRVGLLETFLEEMPDTRMLILCGDVLQNTQHRLTKHHWRVLSLLRKLSDRVELLWVRGNHDSDAVSVAHLIGAHWLHRAAYTTGGRGVVCVHGDEFDEFTTRNPWLTWAADQAYIAIQRWSAPFAARLKRSSKTYVQCAELVKAGAVGMAEAANAQVVVCGHTHHAEHDKSGRVEYVNAGCWTDSDCHYVTAKDGFFVLNRLRYEPWSPSLTAN